MSEHGWFVWVDGLKGPEPQKWFHDGVHSSTGKVQDCIVKRPMNSAEARMSIKSLAAKYPLGIIN